MSILPKKGCGCSCHRVPGVKHMVACCSEPPFRCDHEFWAENEEREVCVKPGCYASRKRSDDKASDE